MDKKAIVIALDAYLGARGKSGLEAMEAAISAFTNAAGAVGGNQAIKDVIAERRLQIKAGGGTTKHEDSHELGELSLAAALYAIPYEATVRGEKLIDQDAFIGLHMALEISCGWNLKPEPDRRKRLVKAAALILAEIERLDRATSDLERGQ